LVLAIVEFTVRLDGVAGGFAEALALEDDYDAAVMERARDLLIKHTFGAAFLPPKMRDIIDAVERINNDGGGKSTTPGKLIGSTEVSDVLSPGAAPTDPQAASDALLAALGPEPDDYDWEATYKAGMETLGTFGEVDGGVPIRDFFSQFAKNSEDDDAGGVPSKAKQKKLARESAALYENQLPCEAGSSIFLRHDPDRFDRCRAVVTGPHGTPYSGGCFVFDVYFPAGYPEKPPMVNLDTTGGGRVRFNPNLYADGKVCLSLLGTWHGGGAEEKWDAKNSSLYQVLVSIQGLILVDDPMFNEPGFDGIRGTTEGDLKSREHNEEIRLYTVRHAMIAHLKKPRPGVGTVLTEHFRLRKWTVMREVLSWCVEASDPTVQKRMWDAARELSQLLAVL
jgi:baculoviral IAP repeat-containing protein 6